MSWDISEKNIHHNTIHFLPKSKQHSPVRLCYSVVAALSTLGDVSVTMYHWYTDRFEYVHEKCNSHRSQTKTYLERRQIPYPHPRLGEQKLLTRAEDLGQHSSST